MRKPTLLFGALCLAIGTASAQGNPVNSADLKWGAAPPVFPKGAQMAVVSGDPMGKGQFVVRLKMPAKYRIPAHHHPTDEYVTVLSGDFHIGMGDALDESKGMALHAGGFAEAPKGMNHFAWTTKRTIVQVSAEGPFSMTYVNLADDPSKN